MGPASTIAVGRKGFESRWLRWWLRCAVLVLPLLAGCDTPYTRRIDQLDRAYQRGELSREDYMRFAHEADRWEDK